MGPRPGGQRALADGVYLGQPYLVRWDEGRLPEVADYIVSSPWERTLDRAFACHAYAHVAASREAQRLLTGLAARGFADVHYDGFRLTVMSLVAAALGRTADADEAFAPAAAVHERMDAPIWTARTRLEWGRAVITEDRRRGLGLLALAEQGARSVRAQGIAAEAAELAGA